LAWHELGLHRRELLLRSKAAAAVVERVFSAVLDFEVWGLPPFLTRCPA